MAEIQLHLGCIKPGKSWDKLPGERQISEPSPVCFQVPDYEHHDSQDYH